MRRNWLRLGLGFGLTLIAFGASGNAFVGSNPQPGSLVWSGFSNGSVSASISGPGFTGTVSAGQFQGYFNPNSLIVEPDGTLGVDDFFRFFCIDLTASVNGSTATYTRIDPLATATQLAELSQLFDQYYPNKTTATYYSGGITNFGDFPDANTSAAFQLAVWEIMFDTDLNLTTGTFTASSSAAALAQTYLTYVAGHSGAAAGWTFFQFTSGDFQDYLSAEYSQPLRQAPEPGSLLLLCSAVFAAGAAALRRRQTA
jgi:hypothetical protein